MKAKGWTYIHVVQKHKNPAIPQKYKHVYNTDVFLVVSASKAAVAQCPRECRLDIR